MQLFCRKTLSRTAPIFVLALLLPLLAGCAGKSPEPGLFAFLDSPASFTATFPPLDKTAVPVTCEGRLSSDEITLTVTDPPRTAGLTVRYSQGACTLEVEQGIPIPLSEQAAEPLTSFLKILTAGNSEADAELKKSPDGSETIVTCPEGILHLNAENLPAAVESPTADSPQPRTIVITSWTQEK